MAILDHLPTIADIDAAASRIASVCIETPLLESPVLNARLGGRLLVKAENLQVTGSFKLRGAFNRLALLTAEERRRGVVARSSGNHGLAIAYCASILNTHAVVVAPASAPNAKIHRIRAYGAEVVLVDDFHSLARVADEITRNQSRVFVPPADDPWIVAGAGTVGREIVQQAASMAAVLDSLLVCCSGGGLTSGCALALSALSPATSIYAVEPIGFEKMAKSLAAGHCVDNEPGGHTICDALGGPYTAEIPFEIVRSRLTGCVAVTDAETKDAMRTAFAEFGLAVEPGGAVGLAAVMSGRFPIRGKTVAVTLSGRNVDLDLAGRALAA
jgi:threonine dehydratase